MKQWTCMVVVVAVAAVTLAWRIPVFSGRGPMPRPMHTDEAVHAVKFGRLLAGQGYRYDPHEFHGPTLNYLTWPLVKAAGINRFADTQEWHYRAVPLVFSILLILMVWLIADGVGSVAAASAAVLAGVSTAMSFYSGYYVQEMLLVCFTFGAVACGWRYVQRRRIGWMIAAGAFVGLMHATKETCVIAMGAMAIALVVVWFWRDREEDVPPQAEKKRRTALHVVVGIFSAVIVSVAMYSSFFTDFGGVVDSVGAIGTYLTRAGGVGSAANHQHPWWYYLRMLAFFKHAPGPWWSEGFILLLAAVGFVAAFAGKGIGNSNKGLLRFLAIYTAAMIVVYSAIPYKTPWSMLGFLHGLILLAGVGAAAILRWIPWRPLKVVAAIVLLAGAVHLGSQGARATGRFASDPRNPYVYAHTSGSLPRVVPVLRRLSYLDGSGTRMRIDVIAPGDDYWPLPWYLRGFDGRTVIYDTQLRADTDAAAVLLHHRVDTATLRADLERAGYYGLRPDVRMQLYVRADLWQNYLAGLE